MELVNENNPAGTSSATTAAEVIYSLLKQETPAGGMEQHLTASPAESRFFYGRDRCISMFALQAEWSKD